MSDIRRFLVFLGFRELAFSHSPAALLCRKPYQDFNQKNKRGSIGSMLHAVHMFSAVEMKSWLTYKLFVDVSREIYGLCVKSFSSDTLTHLSILYKQHTDGILAAEVEDVNVVLNGHLQQ